MKIDCSRELCHGQTDKVTSGAPVGAKNNSKKNIVNAKYFTSIGQCNASFVHSNWPRASVEAVSVLVTGLGQSLFDFYPSYWPGQYLLVFSLTDQFF